MRNTLIILILMALSACNSDKPKNDVDINDKDSGLTDIDTPVPDPDISDNLSDEVSTESDEQPDSDTDTNSVECLDLRYNENTIKTNFPLKDKDGKPTFCRPGCDTPTETDPQCVRNIWEWDNWEEYQVYLEAEKKDPNQYEERECYPWPCKLPDMKASVNPQSFNSKCDRKLTVNGFKANIGTVWTHGMSDSVAGMDFTHTGRVTEYDPEKDEYFNLGHVKGHLNYNEGRYVVLVSDSIPDKNSDYKAFVISILRKDEKYYYELIYDNDNHNVFMQRPPFSGKNWVLIQVKSGINGSKIEVKYARAGIWEWQSIGEIGDPLAQEGNIVGDHLTFITNNREIYYCDLRKNPKHINDCLKINRLNNDGITYEQGNSPKIDTENEYRLVYNVDSTQIFVEVDLADINNPEYTEHEIPKKKELFAGFSVDTVRGNKVVYGEMFDMGSGTPDFLGCFYRFDKKKSYCPQENIHPWTAENLMGYNTFWGKWHLWKNPASVGAYMRDWECYCKESGVCPFEE
ncbi:hypothetical protein KA996_09380 [bacterium]|nr:hypothetical protein [bacterium]